MASHHAEWLALVDVAGPFLTLPALEQAFPQGLLEHDPELYARVKLAQAEWADDQGGLAPDPAIHTQWLRFILDEVLEYPSDVLREGEGVSEKWRLVIPEHHETLVPNVVVVDSEDEERPRLLVALWPRDQRLDQPPETEDGGWAASPLERMTMLCRGLATDGLLLGLVTNGEQWALVNGPEGGMSGYASWYGSLWTEEKLTLRSFRTLLGASLMYGDPTRTLERLLRDSEAYQEEVTDQLGLQVKRAVEVLVQALDRANRDTGGSLLEGVAMDELYQAAVTVMMRLVFVFSAEERELLPLDDEVYQQNYALSPLRAQLRDEADRVGLEVLERREDAWSRLCATFRAVFAGVEHDRLRMAAYGGSLFDPDRYPFLEGRSKGTNWRRTMAVPLPVDNRTVFHLLEALQVLKMRGRGGSLEPRTMSFLALDVEQIGHVYEGLLDHKSVRLEEPYLGLSGAQGLEPEVSLAQLEAAREDSEDKLLELLGQETKKSLSSLRNAFAQEPDQDIVERIRISAGNDEELADRALPFHALLRDDVWGYPIVFPENSVIVTKGEDRRSTQTFYTERSLAEEIVRYALEPLVYEGPAEGTPREEWHLRSVPELLELKVCDPCMGSGAFLVAVIRYLGERVVEAWEELEGTITVEGAISTGALDEELVPQDREEQIGVARRLVAERCIYGVDLNPFAVEMAKMSVWLVTMAKDRPFGFLDHALRSGDSLLGAGNLEQVRHFHPDPERGARLHNTLASYAAGIEPVLEEVLRLRNELQEIPVLGVDDAERQQALHRRVVETLENVRLVADMVSGAAISTAESGDRALDERLVQLSTRIGRLIEGNDEELLVETQALCREMLDAGKPETRPPRQPLHWPLEFPEVFLRERPGFDAIVANPPFLGGKRITGVLGADYRELLVEHVARGVRGNADLCSYFLVRYMALLRPGGVAGSLATNSIAQGDTLHVGLERIVDEGSTIIRAVPSRPWPGTANLEIAEIWIVGASWDGSTILGDSRHRGIASDLKPVSRVRGKPHPLMENADKSFQGSIVVGQGYVLTSEKAADLIKREPRNRDVLFSYLNGRDLSSRPNHSASRFVINFFDWPRERAASYLDCWAIIEQEVRPERQRREKDGSYTLRKPLPQKYWIYADKRPALYAAVANMDRVLVKAQVSSTWAWVYVPNGQVFDAKLIVFAIDDWGQCGVLQSFVHREWMWKYGTTLETRDTYTPTACFETFPFPASVANVAAKAEELHEFRSSVCLTRDEGLTTVANRVDDPDDDHDDIEHLRELQSQLDSAVMKAYGWEDLELHYAFRDVRSKRRLALEESLAAEVVDRLLELNHARHAEEEQASGSLS